MFAHFWQNPKTRRDFILVIVIGTLLALISPFGVTDRLPIYGAWAYWTGLIALGWVAMSFLAPKLQSRLPQLSEPGFYFLISVIMVAFVLPGVLVIQLLVGDPVPISYWPALIFMIWILSAAISGVAYLLNRAYADKNNQDGSAFMARIPAKLAGGNLYAISSEDHYLRIQTARGSDLILMRLADALQELEGFDGMQVHRSWWVARQGVDKITRDNGRITLSLRDGTSVPVSRTYAPKIRQAGWLG